MVGSDIASALSSTTKGNDERIGDVEFSNFEFSVVQFCAYFSETDGMTCQLESNKLVMAYETRLAQKR